MTCVEMRKPMISCILLILMVNQYVNVHSCVYISCADTVQVHASEFLCETNTMNNWCVW